MMSKEHHENPTTGETEYWVWLANVPEVVSPEQLSSSLKEKGIDALRLWKSVYRPSEATAALSTMEGAALAVSHSNSLCVQQQKIEIDFHWLGTRCGLGALAHPHDASS